MLSDPSDSLSECRLALSETSDGLSEYRLGLSEVSDSLSWHWLALSEASDDAKALAESANDAKSCFCKLLIINAIGGGNGRSLRLKRQRSGHGAILH